MPTDCLNICHHIATRITEVIGNLSSDELSEAIGRIHNAAKIFVYGAGRSGLVGRMFAMRIMHLGKTVYFVGDTTTPAIGRGDLLMVISGSGKTKTALCIAQKARQVRAEILLICLPYQEQHEDHIRQFADCAMTIDRRVDVAQRERFMMPQGTTTESINPVPMGSIFELSTLLCVESIVGSIIRQYRIPEAQLKKQHANLE